jgi:phosphoglucomutase
MDGGRTGAKLRHAIREVYAKVGSPYPLRENFHLTEERKAGFTEESKKGPADLGMRK